MPFVHFIEYAITKETIVFTSIFAQVTTNIWRRDKLEHKPSISTNCIRCSKDRIRNVLFGEISSNSKFNCAQFYQIIELNWRNTRNFCSSDAISSLYQRSFYVVYAIIWTDLLFVLFQLHIYEHNSICFN